MIRRLVLIGPQRISKEDKIKKVLIIGASGFLGNKLREVFSKEFQVYGTYYSNPIKDLIQLDIRDEVKVNGLIEEINPDIILLTAAITNVDLCEKDRDLAEAVNHKGVETIVKYSKNRKLIYYSTDSVFDGEKGDYKEEDIPSPLNHYSKTKLLGEETVKTIKNHLILRTCMLYSDQAESPKFINWLIRSLREDKKVNVAVDLAATPTLIDDLAQATLALVKSDKEGIYHASGATALSCYEMAMKIVDVFKYDKSLIFQCKNEDLKREARRPKNSSLNISKLEKEGILMSGFEQGMRKIKESLKKSGFFDNYKTLTKCRICKGKNLIKYLDLGRIPLVNNYVSLQNNAKDDPRFPLEILYCSDCSLSQLSIIVDPSMMYTNYFYRSSISKTFKEHCYEFAQEVIRSFNLKNKDLIVDVASNDGATLQEFKNFGVKVLGVDPAKNLAEIANNNGIPTLIEFWNEETAGKILEKYGEASLINAMNIFAHVDNLDSFLEGVNILLKGTGVFTIELPYLLNFVNKNEFDTTYHEHLSYFLVKPLIYLLNKYKLEIFDIKKFTIHGGSIRVYIKKEANNTIKVNHDSIKWLLELENDLGLHDINTYLTFSDHVEKVKHDLIDLLMKLKNQGKVIAAYGASAKGNVLSNFCGIDKGLIDFIIDDTPEKQGLLTPGNRIPIVPASYLKENKPDYLLLFAWNFAEELMGKTREYKNSGGRYIIPIPYVKII